MCSLEHAALIIEGAMCLHNFLVDYRDNMGLQVETAVFNNEVTDINAEPLVVGNDNYHNSGNISNHEREILQRGLLLRHSLCQTLADHDMHRPSRSEWGADMNTHVSIL